MKIRTLLVCVAVLGLSGGCPRKEPPPPDAARVEPEQPVKPVQEPPKGPTGTIHGTIKFTGTAPPVQKIQNGADPYCARFEMTTETVIVNANQTLRDVIVRIKPGDVPAYTPPGKVIVDQTKCMYRPRIQGAVIDQTLEVKNSDETTHNIHAWNVKLSTREEMDTVFNRGQPKGGPALTGPILPDIDVYSIRCDQHAWMRGFIVVSDNPYFNVSGEDGSFTIDKAPVGSYTLQAWHGWYGLKTAKVTVAEGKTAEVTFTYDGDKDRPKAK